MHIAYRAGHLWDAHLVKDALVQAGVPAFISGEYLTGGVGQLPALDYLAVLVATSDAAAAGRVVTEVEAWMAEGQAVWAADPAFDGLPGPV